MQVFSNPFFNRADPNSSQLSAGQRREDGGKRNANINNESTQSLGKKSDHIKKNFMKSHDANDDRDCNWRYSYAPKGDTQPQEVLNVSRLLPLNGGGMDYDRIFTSETESSRASESFLLPPFENATQFEDEEASQKHPAPSFSKVGKQPQHCAKDAKDQKKEDLDLDNINMEEEMLEGSFVDHSIVSILNSSGQQAPYPNTKEFLKENEQQIKAHESKISNAIKEIDFLLNKHQENFKPKARQTQVSGPPIKPEESSRSFKTAQPLQRPGGVGSRTERSPIEERLKKLEKLNKIEKELVKNDLKASRMMPENNQSLLKRSTILKSPAVSNKRADQDYYTVDRREIFIESTASTHKDSYSQSKSGKREQFGNASKKADKGAALKAIGTSSPGFPEVFCIDCEEYIRVNEVDEHSTNCFKIKKESKKQAQEQLTLGEVNAKIGKANALLRSKLLEFREDLQESDCLGKVQLASSLITSAMENNEDLGSLHSDDKALQQINGQISKIKNSYVTPLILVLTNRASFLCKQKQEILRQYSVRAAPRSFNQYREDEGDGLLGQLKQIERDAKKKQAELEMWKVQSEMLEEENKNLRFARNQKNSRDFALSNINSDVESDSKSCTMNSELTEKTSSLFENELGRISVNPDQSENAYKRLFYAQAFAMKLELPREHPARTDLLISDLFEKAQRFGLTVKEWPGFFRKEFAQTEKL